MSAVFIDTVTGELKYQGTSGTPGILADETGAVPFSAMEIQFPIVSTVVEIDTEGFSGIGNIVFNPAVLFDGNSKITRTIQLRVLLSASTGVTGELKLYNLTLGADVTSSTLSSNDASPTQYTATLTPGGNIPNSSNVYELQLRISSPAEPSPGDYAICSSALIVASYA